MREVNNVIYVQKNVLGFTKGEIMLKQIAFIMSISTVLNGFFMHYDISMEFKRGKVPGDIRNTCTINGTKVNCHCGGSPAYLLFVHGVPYAFCFKHLPVLESEKLMTSYEKIEQILLKSAENLDVAKK